MAGIKHLGIYRSVTKEQVVLDCRILRILFRNGTLLKSQLQGRLNLGALADKNPFDESLARLEELKCLEVKSPHHGTGQWVILTPIGSDHALDLVCAVQIHNSSGTLTKPVVPIPED